MVAGIVGAFRAECRRRWAFDGNLKNLSATVVSVVCLTVIGIAAERAQFVHDWYGSPYVALVAIWANRCGLRCGLTAAVLSTLAYHYFFAGDWSWVAPNHAQLTIYISMFVVACLVSPNSETPNPLRVLDAGHDLPFTRKDGSPNGMHRSGRRYWDVERSGVWGKDCHLGSEYARIYLARIVRGEPRPMLAWVIHDMIRRGKWSGVEAGFASAIERLLTKAGAEPPRQSPG